MGRKARPAAEEAAAAGGTASQGCVPARHSAAAAPGSSDDEPVQRRRVRNPPSRSKVRALSSDSGDEVVLVPPPEAPVVVAATSQAAVGNQVTMLAADDGSDMDVPISQLVASKTNTPQTEAPPLPTHGTRKSTRAKRESRGVGGMAVWDPFPPTPPEPVEERKGSKSTRRGRQKKPDSDWEEEEDDDDDDDDASDEGSDQSSDWVPSGEERQGSNARRSTKKQQRTRGEGDHRRTPLSKKNVSKYISGGLPPSRRGSSNNRKGKARSRTRKSRKHSSSEDSGESDQIVSASGGEPASTRRSGQRSSTAQARRLTARNKLNAAGEGRLLGFGSGSSADELDSDDSAVVRVRGRKKQGGGSGGYNSDEEREEEELNRRASGAMGSGRKRGGGGRDTWSTPESGFRGRGSGDRQHFVSNHKLVLCPLCFEHLTANPPDREPGQKFEKNTNPDPLNCITTLAKGRECALVFYNAHALKQHYEEVHPRSRQPCADDNYLKQKIYSYLTKREREHNYNTLSKRAHKPSNFEEGSSGEDFAFDADHHVIDSKKVLKSDGKLISEYWGDCERANAHAYNELVETIYYQRGSLTPILDEDELDEESDPDINDFVVPDDEDSESEDSESESESEDGRGRRSKRGNGAKCRMGGKKVRKIQGKKRGNKRTGESNSDDEEELSDDQRERERKQQRKEKERQRKKDRTGPPRIAVLADLEEDSVAIGKEKARHGGRSERRHKEEHFSDTDSSVVAMEESGHVETKFWAQCDRCQKWRNLPQSLQPEVEAAQPWFCTMAAGITCDDDEDPAVHREQRILQSPMPETDGGGCSSRAGGGRATRKRIVDSDEEGDADKEEVAGGMDVENDDGAVTNSGLKKRSRRVLLDSDSDRHEDDEDIKHKGQKVLLNKSKGTLRRGPVQNAPPHAIHDSSVGRGRRPGPVGATGEGGKSVMRGKSDNHSDSEEETDEKRRNVRLSASKTKGKRIRTDHSQDAGSQEVGQAEYGFRERKSQKVLGVVGEEWKQMLKARNKRQLQDEEDDYDVAAGAKSKKNCEAVSLLSSGDEDDLEGFVVADSEDDGEGYDQKWIREAILHDDFGTARETSTSADAVQRAGKQCSPRKRLGESGAATKKQSRIVLQREASFQAIEQGDAAKLREILQKDQKKLRSRENGRSLLHVAIAAGQLDCARLLLHLGISKDERDDSEESKTPLLLALEKRETAIAGLLIDQNADVLKADSENTLPLHMAAAACGTTLVVRILSEMQKMRKRDDHVIKTDHNGLQALHYAAGEGNIDIIQLLVNKYDADVDCRDKHETTPLMVLAQAGHHECITTLIKDFRADIRARDMDGMTSLHHAATSGHHKCVQALLEEGAGLNATLPSHTSLTPGATPLHMASCGGHVECVRVLVEYGAAVDLRDDQGWTPLVYADFVRNRDCVVALLQPKNVDVCARQLKNLGDLLQTDRGETKERVVKLIEYAATVPEFYDAINRLVSMDPDVLNRSMSFLLRNPALLNFSSKLAYVRLQLEESFNGSYYSGGFGAHSEVECNLFLDRRNVARDLIQQLLVKQREEMRSRFLQVRWVGEEGMGTGPARELMSIAPRELLALGEAGGSGLSPPPPLFLRTDAGTCHPAPGPAKRPVFAPKRPAAVVPQRPVEDDVMIVEHDGRSVAVGLAASGRAQERYNAHSIERHLVSVPDWAEPAAAGGRGDVIMASQAMLAIGRLVGLALRHEMQLEMRFSGAFWRMLVGAKLLFEQLEEVDPALYRSLEWLMNEPDSTKMLETFFSVTETDETERPFVSETVGANGAVLILDSETPAATVSGAGPGAHTADDSVRTAASCSAATDASSSTASSAVSTAGSKRAQGLVSSAVRGHPVLGKGQGKVKVREIELVPGGTKKAVTERNKAEYAELYAQYKMAKAEGLEEGIKAFRRGIMDVVPASVLDILSAEDLELQLCGMPTIRVQDWKASALYSGTTRGGKQFHGGCVKAGVKTSCECGTDGSGQRGSCQVAIWFWEIVEKLPQAELALLLKFSTGNSTVPAEGFLHLQGLSGLQRFTLACVGDGDERLPTASTCFNLLKIPDYSSKAILEERLHVALHYGSEGFSFS